MKLEGLTLGLTAGGSRPARGAWIEILYPDTDFVFTKSRPARGAWIEMRWWLPPWRASDVAPLAGRDELSLVYLSKLGFT